MIMLYSYRTTSNSPLCRYTSQYEMDDRNPAAISIAMCEILEYFQQIQLEMRKTFHSLLQCLTGLYIQPPKQPPARAHFTRHYEIVALTIGMKLCST